VELVVNLVKVARVALEDLGIRVALVELVELAVLLAPAEVAVMAVMAVTDRTLIAKAALAVQVELVMKLV
jgi:hypothetical protein